MARGLFTKKSVHDLREDSAEKGGLQRSLTGLNLAAMGIGAIVGAGVFVLTGEVAANFAGPGVVFSFLIAALVCVFAAFCYAEFASMIPIAGGAYSYSYTALGEIVAWTIGWVLTFEYLLSAAAIAVGWSAYLSSFLADFGLMIPDNLCCAPLQYDIGFGWSRTGSIINLPAICIIGFIGTMVAVGIKAAAKFNMIIVSIKLGVILLFLVCGVFYLNSANWIPLIPPNTGNFGEFGFSGILRGAGAVFFAFVGFDALSTLAQEARNPQKDMPAGMIGSLGVSTLIYVLVALVLTGIVGYQYLGVPAPFGVAINALGPKFLWLRYMAKFGILIGLTSGILVFLISQSRVLYMMSHDGLLPKKFGEIHKKFHTPFFTTLFITLIGMLICGFLPVGVLGALVAIGTLFAFSIVCLGVLILRYREPNVHRPFKVPFFPWIPIIGTLVCFFQMLALPRVIWIQFILWIFIGYIVYFGYGIRHSAIRKKHK